MEVLRISYIFVIKRSSKEIIFKAQNVRCYHLKDCCGHAHCLLYSILYSASSVLYGNFFLRALYPRVTLSKIYPRSVLSDDSDKIDNLLHLIRGVSKIICKLFGVSGVTQIFQHIACLYAVACMYFTLEYIVLLSVLFISDD